MPVAPQGPPGDRECRTGSGPLAPGGDSDGYARRMSSADGPDAALAIQMLHDRILIRMTGGPGERTTKAGILIPATAEVAKRLVWGEVAGVGQHVRSVKHGERVLFSPEDQYEVELGGETFLVLRERDLQAVASERARGGTGLYL